MRVSKLNLEDKGVIAFNLQKRHRNFTKMLFFILFRYPLIIFDDVGYVKQKVSYKTFLIYTYFSAKIFFRSQFDILTIV